MPRRSISSSQASEHALQPTVELLEGIIEGTVKPQRRDRDGSLASYCMEVGARAAIFGITGHCDPAEPSLPRGLTTLVRCRRPRPVT